MNNKRISVPTTMMKKERQQSAVNIAMRISRRLGSRASRASFGKLPSALYSADDMKSLKKRVGARAKRKHAPAVRAKLTITHFIFLLSVSGSSTSFFNASIASNGMVNSAITSIDATVRNLEYIGKWSMKKSVNGMKLCPHDNNIERIVAASNAHFTGPFTMKSPRMNSISTKAPT